MNPILESPCCFCGYAGKDYFIRKSHHEKCPFYNIGTEMQREAKMKGILHELWLVSLIAELVEANAELGGKYEQNGIQQDNKGNVQGLRKDPGGKK